MIKIETLNKYYNKDKSNQLHVINDVSLSLPSTGFICFIGPSGSGKTTLLNTIGGLDRFYSGKISYEDCVMEKYSMSSFDEYRKDRVGYIFQNYLLLENKTVYENLKIALEIIGIIDEKEQQKRIEYCLNAVGMLKFKKKLARNLSGGQQQRVSIARALLKNSKIIIADEPTGNLDSENTIEVMNILKKVSKQTLVLLVTHNEEVARFFVDRIIHIRDGKIESDEASITTDTLERKNSKKIYLQDLNEQTMEAKEACIHLYTDDESEKTDVTIVIRNNTLYVSSPLKVKSVNDLNIELIDAHYQSMKKEEVDTFTYDTNWYNNTKRSNTRTIFKRQIKEAFTGFFLQSKKQKVFSVIFVILGFYLGLFVILLSNASGLVGSDIHTTESEVKTIVSSDSEQYGYMPTYQTSVIKEAIYDEKIKDVFPLQSSSICIQNKSNLIISKEETLNYYVYPYSMISSSDILEGNLKNGNQVVLSKTIADQMLKFYDTKNSYKDLIGLAISNYIVSGVCNSKANSIYIEDKEAHYLMRQYTEQIYVKNETPFAYAPYEVGNYEVTGNDIHEETDLLIQVDAIEKYSLNIGDTITLNYKTYTIVGTFDTLKSATKRMFITNDSSLIGKQLSNDFSDNFVVDSGSIITTIVPNTDFEYTLIEQTKNKELDESSCYVHYYTGLKLGDIIKTSNLGDLTVIGIYKENDTTKFPYYTVGSVEYQNIMLVNSTNYLYNLFIDANRYFYSQGIYFIFSEDATAYFKEKEYNVVTAADFSNAFYAVSLKDTRMGFLVTSLILLSISLIYIYFSTRSKMIHDIHDIGVYRSLGQSRKQIVGKYATNIFVQTTFTTLLGYLIICAGYVLLMAMLIRYHITSSIAAPHLLLLGIPFLYFANILIGIIPVWLLLNKTPAEINSKYDI